MKVFTHDNHMIEKGDWVSDTTGMYEVIDILKTIVIEKEILFETDTGEWDSDKWFYGDERILLHKEVKNQFYK